MAIQKDPRKAKFGAVAFLDLLGVKGVWARTDAADFVTRWLDVLPSFKHSKNLVKSAWANRMDDSVLDFVNAVFREKATRPIVAKSRQYLKDILDLNVYAFSDTVIVTLSFQTHTLKDNAHLKESTVPIMGMVLTGPFLKALLTGLFFRGAISVGKFYEAESFVIGPAIDEAADWYQQSNWIGVFAAPSAISALEALWKTERHSLAGRAFIRYDIRSKSEQRLNKGFALAWPRQMVAQRNVIVEHFGDNKGGKVPLSMREVLVAKFNEYPVDDKVSPKYQNTLEFFDFCHNSGPKANP